MNRYPLWKNLLILFTIVLAMIYTLPNLYGVTPAIQISTNRQSLAINEETEKRVAEALQKANIQHDGMFISGSSLKVRVSDANKISARDVIDSTLGEGYIVAQNQISNSPQWLEKMGAQPMFLGLDLRGGVHFTMQVDMKAALDKTLDRYAGDARRQLRSLKIRSGEIKKNGSSLVIPFQDASDLQKAYPELQKIMEGATLTAEGNNVTITLPDALMQQIRTDAVKQNINTLHNRVNELGTSEPVIQQAGADRIVVQLPGMTDTAKAKDIIGRTATLEVRMVSTDPALMNQANNGNVPDGYELLKDNNGGRYLVSKQVELTGDNINAAQAGFEPQTNRPSVNLSLDGTGSTIFADLTAANKGKIMAMILIDQGKSEVVTAPRINEPITGGRVQITGMQSAAEANDVALLLRAGSLAAPMQIVEERTIGPSLGAENITKGINSTVWGFGTVAIFMIFYYRLFGIFSTIALAANLLFLFSILSALQATLTLPGIAAMALTLGMAIDSNVLINERIRDELREGKKAQVAIKEGYDHAWDTILDSNLTSLIAGIALLIFGSGPVKGFAIVHCLGIITSIYSSVVVSRAMVNLWYGNRRKLKHLSIGIKVPAVLDAPETSVAVKE
ncbi:protein translocase subunit SecD [Kingella negevensis]|uniref:Protein translocase subunit SecD n=1 Tax=Kingella negevensis TaxID=1522312 RepID=A0A238TEN9_9NEIS|nr:protein translocase subunit SecD [Kingella negevensis]MDK4680830.1 protein translocase subunit SecD [Kingella negevensis]MDK4681447.1 protein translocase subunit SecD [Kingella negevensis]MDK4684270.1 protein translocase subunit SecD [Kingella negevensis]MDK4687897.1 protein translocase subunit SecD [Kingella negevensis]MDK4691833.1 protein translocase subunit SecD [Kingella negevensis]